MNKKWRYVLISLVVLWVCTKGLQIYFHTTYTKEEIDAFFEAVTSKYGVKIVYEIGEDFFPHRASTDPCGSCTKQQSNTYKAPSAHMLCRSFTDGI